MSQDIPYFVDKRASLRFFIIQILNAYIAMLTQLESGQMSDADVDTIIENLQEVLKKLK